MQHVNSLFQGVSGAVSDAYSECLIPLDFLPLHVLEPSPMGLLRKEDPPRIEPVGGDVSDADPAAVGDQLF